MRFILTLLLLAPPAFAGSFEKRSGGPKMAEWTFHQTLDDAHPEHVFRQRVLVITAAAKDVTTAPVLIELCGEWECLPMFSPVMGVAAKKHGAIQVKIEHRFYGVSHPFAELTPSNLRYLSTGYALRDIARILTAFREEWNWQGPMIPLGCSYAGNLAAYLRAERPDLVVAAVAASAPVRARAFVPEKDAFNARIVGEKCARAVRANVRRFETFILGLTPEQFRAELPRLDIKNDRLSMDSFLNLLGDWTGHIVGNDDWRQVCKDVSEDSLDGFLDWFKRYNRVFHPEDDAFETARETSVAKLGSAATMRQWLYQTCTEYGYFQVTDPADGLGPFAKDAASKARMCRTLFGIETLPDTAATNARYYEPMLKSASKILFANAAPDFWTLLSVTPENNTNPALQTVVSEQGGHCSPLKDIKRGEPGPATAAVLRAIDGWLGESDKLSGTTILMNYH